MTANTLAALTESAIPAVAGIYVTLLAHRVVGKKPGESPEYDALHAKHGQKLKLAGPILILCGALSALLVLVRRG